MKIKFTILLSIILIIGFPSCVDEDTLQTNPQAPQIEGITPEAAIPGQSVSVLGANLDDVDTIKINGVPAPILTQAADFVNFLVTDSMTSGPVWVRNPFGAAFGPDLIIAESLEILIDSIRPLAVNREDSVTIYGKNFSLLPEETDVKFGEGERGRIPEPNRVDSLIRVYVPGSATTGPVLLITPSDTITGPVVNILENPLPAITSISPAEGFPGDQVIITGQNFDLFTPDFEVMFNGISATSSLNSSTEIIANVPFGATSGNITIEDGPDSYSGPIFTVLQLSISGIDPDTGPELTQVTITGENFGVSLNDIDVTLNGETTTVISVTDNQIEFIVPDGASSGPVEVTNTARGQSDTGPVFTVTQPLVTVSTLAGLSPNDGIDGPFQAVLLNGLAYYSNTASNQIRTVNTNGVVTTFTGTGQAGFVNGRLNVAQFNNPGGLAVDAVGNIYIADVDNHVIRVITEVFDPTFGGTRLDVQTLAGVGQAGFADGTVSNAQFNQPIDVAVSGATLYVSDFGNHAIRAIDLGTGQVTTVAGNGTAGFTDGTSSVSRLNTPIGISLDENSDLLIADALNHSIRRLNLTNNTLSTITGFLGSGFVDGASNVAQFEVPYDVISDTSGNLLVADGGNHSIRKITDGFTTTLAGNGVVGNQDGDGSSARFNFPTGIIRISDTEFWIFDFNNDRIRKLEID